MGPSEGAPASPGAPDRPDLKSLPPEALAEYMASLGEPPYRARQVMRWLYVRDDADPHHWTNLPKTLRDRLAGEARVTVITPIEALRSRRDRTTKYLWALVDGAAVESVAIFEGPRLTVCFSTQVGCGLGCRFCATGRGGFVRDLTAGEIVDQLLGTRRKLEADTEGVGRKAAGRITNAVAMGQGEPFLNYEEVLAALRIMNSADGLGIGARRITVSTCGVTEGIRKLATEPEQFGLAVSLHAARQKLRNQLMPGVRRWPISELRPALEMYTKATGRRVTLEYAMLAGVNDTDEDLEALAAFCRGLLCHVNLIPANPVAGQEHEPSPRARLECFQSALASRRIETTVRRRHGADIQAACGQLAQRRRPSP